MSGYVLYDSSGTFTDVTEEPSDIPTELEQVRQQFSDGKVLHAAMIHEFTDSYTGQTEVTEGTIWISKNSYKISADQQVVLVDGAISRVYNARQNKLVISRYVPEEDDFAPSRFFSESDEIYTVTGINRTENSVEIILNPDDPFEIFLEVRILLDRALVPLQINAVDQMDNEFKTIFQNAVYQEHSKAHFLLDYPEDADIIDLRK
ncbi:MAG: outer membrane lipoprotein carrier protein LolA [Balneolales bacterium]